MIKHCHASLAITSVENDVNDVDDTVGCPVVHLDHIAAGSFTADGDEGPGEVLGDGDLLPSPRHHWVWPSRESGGQDEAGGHVTEQGGLQGGGARK